MGVLSRLWFRSSLGPYQRRGFNVLTKIHRRIIATLHDGRLNRPTVSSGVGELVRSGGSCRSTRRRRYLLADRQYPGNDELVITVTALQRSQEQAVQHEVLPTPDRSQVGLVRPTMWTFHLKSLAVIEVCTTNEHASAASEGRAKTSSGRVEICLLLVKTSCRITRSLLSLPLSGQETCKVRSPVHFSATRHPFPGNRHPKTWTRPLRAGLCRSPGFRGTALDLEGLLW